MTVALADSLFFSAATSAARGKVLLYLALTMAPFAVVAPLLGPLLDRSKGGRRLIIIACNLLRGIVCLFLAVNIQELALYPLALLSLVLAKAQGITKNALVPSVVDDPSLLVQANSRLALLSILAGTIGAPIAGLFLKVLGGEWALRAGAVVFFVAAAVSLAIPRAQRVASGETVEQRELLHAPSIVTAGQAMGFVRGVVGFITFFGAFILKNESRSAAVFGLLIAASALGNGAGTLIASPLRRRVREESILAGAICIPAVLMVFAARWYNLAALTIAAAIIAASAACGRLAFDSILQRDAHDAVRGRVVARFETRFQLIWVAGGLLAVALPPKGRLGLFVIAMVMLFAGFAYAGAVRRQASDRAAGAARESGRHPAGTNDDTLLPGGRSGGSVVADAQVDASEPESGR